MKKLIIILSVLSCTLTRCAAQNKIQEGEIKAKHASYSIKKSAMDFGKGHPYFIFSSKNKYEHGVPHTSKDDLPLKKSDIHVNEDQIKLIVYDVLGEKTKELHRHKEAFSVWFVFEVNGVLTDTNYSLQENTIITTKEIDAIDARLRAEVKASFTGKNYLNYKAVEYYFNPILF